MKREFSYVARRYIYSAPRGENIRIISVRRSREEKIELYESIGFRLKFDAGESVITELDVARARRPGEEVKRINVDFPAWMWHPWTRKSVD